MKISIYYFTGTGNSLKVAKDLSLCLENVELVQIRQERLTRKLHTDSEVIGFVVPTIFSGIPRLVHQFINHIEILNQTPYIFTIATYGDFNGMGIVYEQIHELLGKKGLSLSACFGIQMPHNMPEKDHVTTPQEKERLFKEEAASIHAIAEDIRNRRLISHHPRKIKGFFERMNYNAINKFLKKNPFDRGFIVSNKCISCTVCSKVCPAGNIEMTDGKPKWKHENCQSCFACIQWCPMTAIDYKKGTVGIERYHHPDIKASELFNR